MSEEKIQKLVDELSQMTVLDMSKLKKALEDAWDVKAAAGAPMMMAAPAGGDAGAAAEEATDFQVILDEFPADKKIGVIKIVREVTGLGLKEAKELVESAPKAISESAPKSEADEIKKKLEETGAKVTLKGL
ncbi:MAG: 50S ribosomal protein L7/L12 [Chlamydiia bacterium]|nr:50S ribosomal protein L7/L12 [Chlamydiia bacterium]MCH9615365.1 50S ribosomal protein L7/L12 [Chlamydiia bacterium]MCH9628313.1 50S ribosomal protein L7/L12 [Chlamydiia bacterium]